jgi:hypothetical protein
MNDRRLKAEIAKEVAASHGCLRVLELIGEGRTEDALYLVATTPALQSDHVATRLLTYYDETYVSIRPRDGSLIVEAALIACANSSDHALRRRRGCARPGSRARRAHAVAGASCRDR